VAFALPIAIVAVAFALFDRPARGTRLGAAAASGRGERPMIVLFTAIILAQALPYPNPRDQNCAPSYRSSGGYCAPIDERSAPAIPNPGQAQCPSGWTSSSHSCVKIESPRERDRRRERKG
jgi:hypothetical protein